MKICLREGCGQKLEDSPSACRLTVPLISVALTGKKEQQEKLTDHVLTLCLALVYVFHLQSQILAVTPKVHTIMISIYRWGNEAHQVVPCPKSESAQILGDKFSSLTGASVPTHHVCLSPPHMHTKEKPTAAYCGSTWLLHTRNLLLRVEGSSSTLKNTPTQQGWDATISFPFDLKLVHVVIKSHTKSHQSFLQHERINSIFSWVECLYFSTSA